MRKTEIKNLAVPILAALIAAHGSSDEELVARSLALASKLSDAVDALPDEEPTRETGKQNLGLQTPEVKSSKRAAAALAAKEAAAIET